MGFSKFNLHEDLMRSIHAAGFQQPTPIQTMAIPALLEGGDLIGRAQTGTGKTAAFVLPLLHRLAAHASARGRNTRPLALILTPTRELAQQVYDATTSFGRFLSLRSVCLYGGAGMAKQLEQLRRGTHVVVATPGRLLDHLQRGSLDLSSVQVLVLDEADRMLDMGFINDVRKIIAKIPAQRQTMLFSATLSPEITSLASTILRNPQTLDAGGRHNPVETITQRFYSAPRESKMQILLHALQSEDMTSVLVFSRTKHGADKISRRLEHQGITSGAIHSNRTQPQRERVLDAFKRGKLRVLVATDIAARGIDVTGISHVVNYDVPQAAEDYVHRIGRTGRAGATGEALTFVGADERQYLRRIEQFTGKRCSVERYPGADAAPVAAQQTMPSKQTVPAPVREEEHRPQRPSAHTRRRKPARATDHKGGPAKRNFRSGRNSDSWSNY